MVKSLRLYFSENISYFLSLYSNSMFLFVAIYSHFKAAISSLISLRAFIMVSFSFVPPPPFYMVPVSSKLPDSFYFGTFVSGWRIFSMSDKSSLSSQN